MFHVAFLSPSGDQNGKQQLVFHCTGRSGASLTVGGVLKQQMGIDHDTCAEYTPTVVNVRTTCSIHHMVSTYMLSFVKYKLCSAT